MQRGLSASLTLRCYRSAGRAAAQLGCLHAALACTRVLAASSMDASTRLAASAAQRERAVAYSFGNMLHHVGTRNSLHGLLLLLSLLAVSHVEDEGPEMVVTWKRPIDANTKLDQACRRYCHRIALDIDRPDRRDRPLSLVSCCDR